MGPDGGDPRHPPPGGPSTASRLLIHDAAHLTNVPYPGSGYTPRIFEEIRSYLWEKLLLAPEQHPNKRPFVLEITPVSLLKDTRHPR